MLTEISICRVLQDSTEGLPVGTLCGIQVEDEADVAAFKDAVPEDFVGGASAAAPAEEAPKIQEAPKIRPKGPAR
ncbi:MAG: hypothetical protein MHM6MM_004729 [Cercozoa sp. M6MM]